MDKKIELKFNKVLSQELQKRGLNANSLSLKSGIPRSTIYSWLSGAFPDSRTISSVKVLADFFGIDLEYLLFGSRSIEDENLVINEVISGLDGVLYRVKVSTIKN
jgi:predicted transcriptional regulator